MMDDQVKQLAQPFFREFEKVMESSSLKGEEKIQALVKISCYLTGKIASIMYFSDTMFYENGEEGLDSLVNLFKDTILDEAKDHIQTISLLNCEPEGNC